MENTSCSAKSTVDSTWSTGTRIDGDDSIVKSMAMLDNTDIRTWPIKFAATIVRA